MKIGVFHSTSNNSEHAEALWSMYKGAKNLNIEAVWETKPCDCDVAVVWGIEKKLLPRTKIRREISERQKKHGGRVIVIEKGYIKRDEYYSAGYDSQNGWADFNNYLSPPDRRELLDLNIETNLNQKHRENILLCGQVPWDTSVQDINYKSWCKDIIKAVRQKSDKKIIFRPHPLGPEMDECIDGIDDCELSINKSIDFDINRASCVLAYNSNSLVDAALKGVPVFAFNNGAMTWNIANKNLLKINNPNISSSSFQWLNDICYAQWTLQEMKSGKTLTHLLK